MTIEHRVRYHETDAQGFMFNSRYLEIADVAMTEFFRDLGWAYIELNAAGMDPSVVVAQLAFQRPVRFDDILQVHVSCPRVGRSSFVLVFAYCVDSVDVARAELTYVNVDAGAEISRSLPNEIAQRLTDVRIPHNDAALHP